MKYASLSDNTIFRIGLAAAIARLGHDVPYSGAVRGADLADLRSSCTHVVVDAAHTPTRAVLEVCSELSTRGLVVGVLLGRTQGGSTVRGLEGVGVRGLASLNDGLRDLDQLLATLDSKTRGSAIGHAKAKSRFDRPVFRDEDDLAILHCLAGGSRYADAARKLNLSERTVKRRVAGMKTRLGVSTRFQLAHWAAQAGISGDAE